MQRASLVIAFCVVATSAAAIEPTPTVPRARPLQLRLKGTFEPTRDAARRAPDAITVALGDRTRWFAVDEARTVGGDQPLFGRDVLAALAPLQPPTLRAVGPPELRGPLDDAADGAHVDMEGIVDAGAHTYLLRKVAVGAPDATP